MTRFARPAGSLFAGSRFVQLAVASCRPPVGASYPPLVVQHAKKKPAFSCELFFKYGGEGGIDSLCSPCGQPVRYALSLSSWLRQLSNPGRGFSSPLVVQHAKKKPAFSCELFFKYGGEGGIRTPDTLPYTHFPGVLLQPLGHLTILSLPLLPGTGANLGKYVSLVNQLFQKTAYLDKLRATCFFNARQSFFLSPPAFYSIEK